MDQNKIAQQFQAMELNAQANVMRAQQDHEIAQALGRVRNLAEQVADRAVRLGLTAEAVSRAANAAENMETFAYPAGAFGQDAATLDGLLVALDQSVSALATLRARKAVVEAEKNVAVEGLSAFLGGLESEEEEDAPAPVVAGQYL